MTTTADIRTKYLADVRRVGLRNTFEVLVRSPSLPSDAELIAMCWGRTGIVRNRGTAPGGARIYLVTVTR